jgi:osmoprotectant transport system substrate-binding protein
MSQATFELSEFGLRGRIPDRLPVAPPPDDSYPQPDYLRRIGEASSALDRGESLDCLLGLQEVYGLEFQRFVPVDIALRHEVLTKGQADVSIVFTTDPQIQREEFVLLEDDQGMFPPYNSTLVMRNEVAEQGGAELEEVVSMVNEGLNAEAMQELNARVDLDKKTPQEVAGEYLSETGLVQ